MKNLKKDGGWKILDNWRISKSNWRVWEIKGVDVYEFVKAYKICLIPDVVFLWKFKVSQFTKYISVECPRTHLSIYCSKMVEMIKDDTHFIYFFYESLNGNVLSWYTSLDGNKIR